MVEKTHGQGAIVRAQTRKPRLNVHFSSSLVMPPSNDNSTQMSNVIVMVDQCPLSETTVLETPTTMLAPASYLTPSVPGPSLLYVPGTKGKIRTDESVFANVSLADASANDDLDLSRATSGYFLDSTRIFFTGFGSSHIQKLKRIINAGGGTRKNQLTQDVTHLVLGRGKFDRKVHEAIKNHSLPETTSVVTATWLTECFQHGKMMHTNRFIHPLWSEMVPVVESPIHSKR